MSSVDTVPILPDKVSKRADKVALTISIIALIVSCISLWDSHGAARVQYAAVKPVPTVQQAHIGSHSVASDPLYHSLLMWVTVTHMGVKIKTISIKPQLWDFLAKGDVQKACFADLNKLTFTNDDARLNMNLGTPSVTDVAMEFPASCNGVGEWTFVGQATFIGADDSGHTYSEPASVKAAVKD